MMRLALMNCQMMEMNFHESMEALFVHSVALGKARVGRERTWNEWGSKTTSTEQSRL